MQFKDIIGQQAVIQHLTALVAENRLSHALLFLGKEGSGALPLALAFAQYVVCEKVNGKNIPSGPSLFGEPEEPETPAVQNDSCGVCSACTKAAQYIHPDIHFSFPVVARKNGDKPVSSDYITEWRQFLKETPYGNAYDWLQSIGAENRQGNITAEECNVILHQLSLKSFESEYKVQILWMPEYLSKEGNKLLKLIEEPPANTLFLLVAENYDAILPTIVSRCQLIRIPAIERTDIEKALKEKEGASPEAAQLAALLSEGSYRNALQVMHNGSGSNWQSVLREWLNAILIGGPMGQVKWVEAFAKEGRENQKQFLLYFIHLLEQSVRLQYLGNQAHLPEMETDFARRLNKIANINQQEAIAGELDKAVYYIERNANSKLLFHALSIKLQHIIKDNALILAR